MKNIHLRFKCHLISAALMAFFLNSALGQVATLQNWTSVYHGTISTQQNINYPVQTGSDENRVLVVAVASARQATGSVTVNLTYGGQPLTTVNGDMGTATIKQHTALYYLNESGLDAAANTTLAFTVSGGTNGNTDVMVAVFDNVKQDSPIAGSQNYSSGTTPVQNFSFASPLSLNAYGHAVEVVSGYLSSYNQSLTITYAPDWTMVLEQYAAVNFGLGGISVRNGIAGRSVLNLYTTDNSPTSFSRAALASMTGVSLNYQMPPAPTIQASNVTFSGVTSSSMTINWTPGNGTNRIVLVKQGSAVDSDPVNETTYTASDIFGSGSQIGTGNYVVYNGTGNSVTLLNLDGNTTYHVAVYEFSGPPGLEYYLTTILPARGSQLTAPETALTDDYRSGASGNWGIAATWQTFDGTSWVPAGTPPNSASGIITIRDGHTVTITEAVAADQVVIESQGQVTVNPSITWTIDNGTDAVDCNVNGTINNSGTISTTGVLTFNNGSEYNHTGNGGTIPTATWDANSTCSITGITNSALTGFGQIFGNFIWNCGSQTPSSVVPMNSDVTVQGDFTLMNTGSGRLAITDGNTTKTITISGNFYQSGGTFDLNNGLPSTAANYLKVARNFSFTGGTITESSSSGSGVIVFNGNGTPQIFTSGGNLNQNIDFRVESGAYLQMGTGINPSKITDSKGTFALLSGSTLGITDRFGITASATGSGGGNIQVTGTRSFDPGASYIYNGSGTQHTNNGLPSTVNSLVFNNSSGTIFFDAAHIITNDFSIMSGSKANLGTFTHTTGALVLGGSGQQGGSYGGTGSGADYVLPEYFADAPGLVVNGSTPGTWLGITTDWNAGANWIGGVPTDQTNAKIYAHAANQPLISGTTTALSNSVTINSGASLTIDNTGKATFSSLVNNGNLYLNSNAAGIASLITGTYSGSGNTNIQLYLTGGEAGTGAYRWHYISSPVTPTLSAGIFEAQTSDLAQFIEGNYTGLTEEGWIASDGYIYSTGTYGTGFDNLLPGKGYNYWNDADYTFTFGGSLNTAALNNIPLSYSGESPGSETYGFNLLGNPFFCGISWDVISESVDFPANTSKSVFFTKDNVQYTYSNGVGIPEGTTGHIPPMQGFFVKTSSSGNNLTIPLNAREHNTTQRYKGSYSGIPLIRLSISENGSSDETVIRFDNLAKSGIDYDFDAVRLTGINGIPSIASKSGNTAMIINGLPFPDPVTEVPLILNLSPTKDGFHSIRATQIEGLGNYYIYLIDNKNKVTVSLNNNPEYRFYSTGGISDDRFILRITDTGAEGETKTTENKPFNIYSALKFINIQTLNDDWDGISGTIKISLLTGSVISSVSGQEFNKTSIIKVPEPARPGIYIVELQSGSKKYTTRIVIR